MNRNEKTDRLCAIDRRQSLFCAPAPATMHDAATIQLAIRNCIALCVQSEYPLTCLSDFMEKLREHHWDEEKVAIVERQVLKAIVNHGQQQFRKTD